MSGHAQFMTCHVIGASLSKPTTGKKAGSASFCLSDHITINNNDFTKTFDSTILSSDIAHDTVHECTIKLIRKCMVYKR